MEFKFIYLVIIGIIFVYNYFKKLKKQQAEAEKKHPPPQSRVNTEGTPRYETPRPETLEDIFQRAADEARRERTEKQAAKQQRQRRAEQESARTWVPETPKPLPRKSSSPFLTQDNPGYRRPQMEAITSLEGNSLETIGEEGGISISDVHKPIEMVTLEEPTPTINLRQALLHQIILERPRY